MNSLNLSIQSSASIALTVLTSSKAKEIYFEIFKTVLLLIAALIEFTKYAAKSAIESGRIVGAGYYGTSEDAPMLALMPATNDEVKEDDTVGSFDSPERFETVQEFIDQFCVESCELGEWFLSAKGNKLKSEKSLRANYQKAIAAYL